MTRDDVVEARRAWVKARERVSELEAAVAAAEERLEQAHYGWEQWEHKSDVLTTIADLDTARDKEREAWHEYDDAKQKYSCKAKPAPTR
jgi:hypothetical protein